MFFGAKENWKTCKSMEKDFSYAAYWEKHNRLAESLINEVLFQMPPLCRYAYFVYQLEGEVNNSGFDQYFFNSAGYDAPEALEALEAFGLKETKKLLERALNLLYTKIDKADYKKICAEQELPTGDFQEELGELDGQFYSSAENIEEIVNEYLDKHRAELVSGNGIPN